MNHIGIVFMGRFPVAPDLRRFLPTLAASVSVAASFFVRDLHLNAPYINALSIQAEVLD